MKKLQKFWVILVAVALVFGVTGCPTDGDGDKDKDKDKDKGKAVEFTNFSTPSIFVENLSGERLVAFKGSLNPTYLISGVPAYSGKHGLKKDPALFNNTGAFVLLLITETQYNSNKKNLGALNNEVFARVFAFYNHSATNNNVFQISSKIGGQGRLTISNPSNFNVEIRKDGPTGEILGYAAAQMTSGNVIYLNAPDSYDIYPLFKFFNPVDNELYSVTPKYQDGALQGKPFMKTLGFGGTQMTHTFNIQEIEDQGSFNLTTGSMYLRIINNSFTGVRFWDGTQPVITSIGIEVINSNDAQTFSIRFPRNVDGTFPTSRSFAQLRIGTTQLPLTIPTQNYDLDYVYEIEVTGSTASNLTLGTITRKEQINVDQMFGLQ
jgi:hypothetical protein